MIKFREYTRANYKSDISEIFGNEGIPGDYAQYVAPVDIKEDQKQVFGLMLGQISEASKRTSKRASQP